MNLLRCYKSEKNSGNIGKVSANIQSKNVRRRFRILNFVDVAIVVLILAGVVECALPLSKQCEDVTCQELEYCRQVDHTCQSCADICEQGTNNYDEKRCESDCQDYIHDARYQKLQNSTVFELQRVEMEEKYKKLENDVLILKYIVCVCVVVILVVVAVLAAFLVYFWKLLHPGDEPSSPEEKKKKGSSIKSATSHNVELPTIYNNRYGVTTPSPEMSPSSVISTSPADTNVTTFTTSTSVPPSYHPVNNNSSRARTVSDAGISLDMRASPDTVTTTLTSAASTLAADEFNSINRNVGTSSPINKASATPNRFRREPSESTLPENCAYDNLSMSPQHNIHYSHHV